MTIHRIAATRRALLASAILLILSGPAIGADAPRVKFTTTAGDFVIEVYPDKAPKTVENFLQYVKDKHYDGTIFHRVIDNFMVQGGGFDAKYVQKPTRAAVTHEGRDALAKGGARTWSAPWPWRAPTTPTRQPPSSSST
jgi:peptidyl-prolyl cis-trans isomerase A (cyclophilin A)